MIDLPASLARWSDDWRFAWEERAAIMEYDAGMSREKAELAAYYDVRRQRERSKKHGV